jgi:hypothetical protein
MEMPMAKQVKHLEAADDGGFDDMYGSNWTSPDDIKRPLTAKIKAQERQTFKGTGGAEKDKLVLTLEGVKKPVVCNKTNALNLATAFGKVPAHWVGKHVTIKAEMTSYAGKPVKGVRLYPADPDDMQGDKITY